ncbi:DnaD and phage-associated domain-containing protein [Peptoclostridium litorale DSM 5388]|uniref:DnaD domain-containing protein n=1 Tax=Peptoclostridium litorale DSM 5388 TaxID=1121324 RepID=A0A069RHS2_PEPLI|nr:DnaD domain protein [Peptoclostridium litorale]KDR96348.1 DnaD domain-containing protein [Peptoclostridium litorale DSM 5388]SIO26770.1 DnaD and phage-associated domain-containing protein [Peptoclostridium litorale DSM 5388]
MFYKEKSDVSFGQTPIDNIFIDIFMPMANGTFVMVYLLGYRYSLEPYDSENSPGNITISKNLGIPLSDVLSAWEFWEGKGIVKRHSDSSFDDGKYSVEFMDLKRLYLENIKPHSLNSSTGSIGVNDLIQLNENESIRGMFNSVNEIISRELAPNEKQKILQIMERYNMPCDIIKAAYSFAKNKKGIKNVNFVEGIIRNWYDMNISDISALEEYLKERSERMVLYSRVFRSLGFTRQPSQEERKVMDSWMDGLSFDMDIILKACSKSKNTSNPSIAYIDGILKSWHSKGFTSAEDTQKEDAERENQKIISAGKNTQYQKNQNPYKTKFHYKEERSSRYTPEELEKILLENQRKKFK